MTTAPQIALEDHCGAVAAQVLRICAKRNLSTGLQHVQGQLTILFDRISCSQRADMNANGDRLPNSFRWMRFPILPQMPLGFPELGSPRAR